MSLPSNLIYGLHQNEIKLFDRSGEQLFSDFDYSMDKPSGGEITFRMQSPAIKGGDILFENSHDAVRNWDVKAEHRAGGQP